MLQEILGTVAHQIAEGRITQVRHDQSQDAAGLQHTPAFGQERPSLGAVEVLQHVRGIDRVHGARRLRNTAGRIGITDALAAAGLDEGKGMPIDQAQPLEQACQTGPSRQPDGR